MKAVFFDFDGVLTTDKTGTTSVCNYIGSKTGMSPSAFGAVYSQYNAQLSNGRLTHRDVWDDICTKLNKNIPYDLLFESFIHTPIDNDMLSVLKQIKSIGLKTGMITDNKLDRVDAIIAYYNWYSLFDTVVVSADIGSGKRNKDIFDIACSKAAVKPDECIFIDNKRENLLIPEKMGMKTFLYDDALRDIGSLIMWLRNLGIETSL